MTNGDVSAYVLRARTLLAELERCKTSPELNYFLGGVLEGKEDSAGDERTEAAMYSLFLNGALCALLSTKLDQQHLDDVVTRIVECVVSDLQSWSETAPGDASATARSRRRWLVDRAARAAPRAGTSHSGQVRPVSQIERRRSLESRDSSVRRDELP